MQKNHRSPIRFVALSLCLGLLLLLGLRWGVGLMEHSPLRAELVVSAYKSGDVELTTHSPQSRRPSTHTASTVYTPSIAIAKMTNGFNVESPPGPELALGDLVTWTYVVTNTGNVTLNNIFLVDVPEGDVTSGCPSTTLMPNLSMTCLLTSTVTAVGQYTNSATVTAIHTEIVTFTQIVTETGTLTDTGTTTGTLTGPITSTMTFTTTSVITVTDVTTSHYFGVGVGIGNLVWHDADNDGQYEPEAGEEGIDGVEVHLYHHRHPNSSTISETLLLTTTTADGGIYHFDDLTPGLYSVRIPTVPVTYPMSSNWVNWHDDGEDNDNNGRWVEIDKTDGVRPTIRSPEIQLSIGDEPETDGDDSNGDLTIDFGLWRPAPLLELTTALHGVELDQRQNYTAAVTPPGPLFTAGELVTWTHTMTNAGNVTLTNLALTSVIQSSDVLLADSQAHQPVACPTTTLAPSQTITCTLSTIIRVPGQVTYTTYLSGTPRIGVDPIIETEPIRETTVRYYRAEERFSLGNRVWLDHGNLSSSTNAAVPHGFNDGIHDELEAGIPGVTLILYLSGTTSPLMTTTTDVKGEYLFDDLVAGEYRVEIPAQNFQPDGVLFNHLSSSIVEPDPNTDGDQNNNGLAVGDPASTGVHSGPIRLEYGPTFEPHGEETSAPDGGEREGAASATAGDLYTNLTIDFGFISNEVELGDLLWLDMDNDGVRDAGEPGLNDVRVELYRAGDPLSATALMTTTTMQMGGADGRYLFRGIPPGDYVVHIPATEFQLDGPLAGYLSSTPTELDPNDDENEAETDAVQRGVSSGPGDENGRNETMPAIQGVSSGVVTLSLFGEPTGEDLAHISHLNDAHANLTVDFGFYQPVQVGDRVWFDANANGVYEPSLGEEGVAHVAVQLYQAEFSPDLALPSSLSDVDPIGTTETDLNGIYTFTNLVPGVYLAKFLTSTLPVDLYITQPNLGVSEALDSDADPITGLTHQTGFLQSGQHDQNLDMGVFRLVSVSGRVWQDLNRNGLQDEGVEEATGVAGVAATLYYAATNQPVPEPLNPTQDRTTTTDRNGQYRFDDLIPGDYYVLFDLTTLPARYFVTTQNSGGDLPSTDAIDSDADPKSGQTTPTGFLFGDNHAPTESRLDMGIFAPVVIGDTVWHDRNRNGLYEPNGLDGVAGNTDDEPPVEGITVNLYVALGDQEDVGSIITTTQTNASGNYLFTDLDEGNYLVAFELDTLPPGYRVTVPGVSTPITDTVNSDATDSDATNSDAAPDTGLTPATGYLSGGTQFLTRDMGIWTPTSVEGRVWIDLDGNGRQDSTETEGIADVSVSLFATEAFAPSSLTEATVENEQQIDGSLVDVTTTNATGYYTFTDLPPGNYYVLFAQETLPPDYQITTPNAPSASDVEDSDVYPDTGESHLTGFIYSGELGSALDMGVWIPVSIGSRVWFDHNWNGRQDLDEVGVPDVQVRLYGANTGEDALSATPLYTATTDATGSFAFTDLMPGNYIVIFETDMLPPGYVVSQPNAVDDALDSDANPSTGQTPWTGLLSSGMNETTIAMGIHDLQGVRIGDTVWHDLNANGLQEHGEPGVASVLVSLYAADSPQEPLRTTLSDENGSFLFDGLPPGAYYLIYNLESLPVGYHVSPPHVGGNANEQIDSDVDPLTGQTPVTDFLSSGSEHLTLDLGLYQLAQIGDRVWFDQNVNGLQDPGEPGVAEVMVSLFYGDGAPTNQTSVTDSDGAYHFSDLVPGTYWVEVAPPIGFLFGPDDEVVDLSTEGEQIDSDVNPETGRTTTTMLHSSEHDWTWDAGLYMPVALGNFVWFDEDNNGIRTSDEEGIGNVLLNLYHVESYDSGSTLVMTTTTDANGFYLFDILSVGDYVVEIAPQNFQADGPLANLLSSSVTTIDPNSIPSESNIESFGDDDDNGLDVGAVNRTGIRSGMIQLHVGEEPQAEKHVAPAVATVATDENTNFTIDFGFYEPLSLGNRIWIDENYNSLLDEGEIGPDGVVVHLYQDNGGTESGPDPDGKPDGAILQSTVTADGGYYLFDNLAAGHYLVEVARENFMADGLLVNMVSSSITTVDPHAENPYRAGSRDGDDNGLNRTPMPAAIRSGTVYLSATNSPVAEVDVAPSGSGIARDQSSDLTIDFGFYEALSLGNQVWLDANNDGQLGVGESGINDVLVHLYRQEIDEDISRWTIVTSDTTSSGGYYLFSDLRPGNYLVEIASENFAHDGPLPGFQSSKPTSLHESRRAATTQNLTVTPRDILTGTTPHELSIDNDDNGLDPSDGTFSGVHSAIIPLALHEAPIGESNIGPQGLGDAGDSNSNLSIDFGFYEPVSVGGRVWQDDDANGEQGDLEQIGISNIQATLYRVGVQTPISMTVTGAAGGYRFNDLVPGDYYVVFDLSGLPTPFHRVTAANVFGASEAADSDVDSSSGQSTQTGFLTSGTHHLTLDMGIYQPVGVGGTVWFDKDADGLYEPKFGEIGISQVVVSLFHGETGLPVMEPASPEIPRQTETNQRGDYLFSGLEPGVYFVSFDLDTLPNSMLVTERNVGQNDFVDSDVEPATGQSDPTEMLHELAVDLSLDMGVYGAITVGNRVWVDDNYNGIQDPGERGLPNVKATLYSAGTNATVDNPLNPGTPLTTLTREDGLYTFSGLPVGGYFVEFDLDTLPSGFAVTHQNAGGSDGADSDADPISGRTGLTGKLNGGDVDYSLDMGIWTPVSLRGRVWEDRNVNGLQDLDEPGVPHVLTVLRAPDGAPVLREDGTPLATSTDPDGYYQFHDFPPGTYSVHFEQHSIAAGYVATLPFQGASHPINQFIDSDVDPLTGQTPLTQIGPGGINYWGLHMGVIQGLQIAGRVWIDKNRDGIQDSDEKNVPNVIVTLVAQHGQAIKDVYGNLIESVQTDANGRYGFEQIPPGVYSVAFDLASLPEGYSVTLPRAGSNDQLDSDVNPSTGRTPLTMFVAGRAGTFMLDMGIHAPVGVRIGDTVWNDLNANGIQDADEYGVPGISVALYVVDSDGNGQYTGQTTTTAINGTYLFDELPPGNYYVIFDLTTLPDGYGVSPPNQTAPNLPFDDTVDSDADPATGQTGSTGVLPVTAEDISLDMGVYQLATLGDRVWLDSDADGVQDPGESGLPGVLITLYQGDDTTTGLSTTTDVFGRYSFTNLVPAEYYVEVTSPDNYSFSPFQQGGHHAADSDVNSELGRSPTIMLQSGEENRDWDIGFFTGSAIGNRVWYDSNTNGIQDPDEFGVFNVTVQLYDGNGGLVDTTTTDAEGFYGFSQLAPGNYQIAFVRPRGFVMTWPNQGNDETADSDPAFETDQTEFSKLDAGKVNPNLDAGMVLAASIGNYVWFDQDGDGLKDKNEEGVPHVAIILYNENDEEPIEIARTKTDATGFYQFADLIPGKYSLRFIPPLFFDFTKPDTVGSSNPFTSKADLATGQTVITLLEPAENETIWGAGLVSAAGAVTLNQFMATLRETSTGQEIAVVWRTPSELDTFGFYLHRGTDEFFDSTVRVSNRLVPGEDSQDGRYEIVIPHDPTTDPAWEEIRFWLVEAKLDGRQIPHGPVRVRLAGTESSVYLPLILNE
ncbi:hypothetical protein KFU94_07020 [Chloroflexi bacterium TSY]|nr:hypothetical protein [Chloroflexi bacterium TSY]